MQLNKPINQTISFIVLHGLVELGQQQSLRTDVKSMSLTWKHLSKLACGYRSTYHTVQKHHPTEIDAEDYFDWMSFCVQNICNLISNNIDKILEMVNIKSQK